MDTDVSARSSAELQANLASIGSFPNENPDPVLRADATGKLVYANAACTPLLETWSCWPGELLPERLRQHLTAAHQTRCVVECEETCRNRIFSLRFTPVSDRQYVNIYGRDISEYKRIEETLRQSQERYRMALKGSPIVVWECDRQLRFTFVDNPQPPMTDPGLILGKRDDEILAAASVQEIVAIKRRVLATGRGERCEVRVPTEQRVYHFDFIAEPVWGTDGTISGLRGVAVDMTARNESDEALRAGEQMFKRLVENSPDIISRIDRAHRHIFVSPAIKRATGLEPEHFAGKTNAELGMPEELCRVWRSKLEEGFTSAKPVTMEFEYPSPGGTRYFSSRIVPEFGADGTVESLLGIARDVTERKRAEEELRQRVEEMERLLDVVPAAVWVAKDPACSAIVGNACANELYGTQTGENVSASARPQTIRHFAPDGRELSPHELPMQVAASTNRPVLECEVRVLLGSGRSFTVFGGAAPLLDQKGQVRGCVGAFIDITERKKAEEALRNSEEKFSALFQASPVAKALAAYADGTVQDVNPAWLQLTGFSRKEEVIGKTSLELGLIPDPECRKWLWNEFHQNGHVRNAEIAIRTQTGQDRTLLVSLETIEIGAARFILSTNVDVTEQKRAEHESRRLAAMIEATPDFVAISGPDGDLVYVNPAGKRMLGMPVEADVRAYSHNRLCPTWVYEKTEKEWMPAALRDGSVSGEGAVLTLAGQEIPVSFVMLVHRSAGGQVEFISTMARDVAEQKRAEAALKRSEELFKRLVQNSPDIIARFDREHRHVFISDAVKRLTGMEPERFIGKTNPELGMDPELCRIGEMKLGEALAGKKVAFEFSFPSLDGSRDFSCTLVPERDEDGSVQSVLSITREVTEQKRAEARQKAKQAELELILNRTPFMLTRCSRTLHYRYVSRAYAEAIGRRPEQLAGKPIVEIMGQKGFETIRPHVEKVLRGETVAYEAEVEFEGAGSRYLAVTYVPDRDEEGTVTGWIASIVDLTERKRAQEALRRSEERLDSILASIQEQFLVLDSEWRYLYLNNRVTEATGKTREDLLGKSIWELFPETSASEFATYMRKVAAERQPAHFELYFEPWKKWFENHIYPTAEGVAVLVTDITERKQAEEALRQSEERYRAVASIVTDIVWRTDAAGDYVEPQHSWEKYTGQTWEQHRGSLWVNALHPEDRERVAKSWRHACETRSLYESRGRMWHAATQSWRYFVGRAVPLLNPDGTVREWVGCDADVHEQRMAEEALRASEERFRAFMDNSPAFAWVKDEAGRYTYISKSYQNRFGLTLGQVLGKTDCELWNEAGEAFRKNDLLVLASNAPLEVVEEAVDQHGRHSFWLNTKFVFSDAAGRRFVGGVGVDITERREAEKVLQRSKRELENLVSERTAKLQELVGELEHFSYTITHDMRAPLRAMRAFAEALKDASEQRLGDEERLFVGRIITGAERMDALITDALSYSKAVRQELTMAPVNLGRLLRGMLDTYPEYQSANAEIEVAQDLPLVMGNEAALTQCFSNLLANAVKFVKPGEKALVRIRAERLDGWVRLWVEDNGIGISKEMLPRVFDMFSRGSSPAAGTGIGLALVRKVVDRMGGKLGVESELGKGTRFWVELKAGDHAHTVAETLRAVGGTN